MIKKIVKDEFFLKQKSEPATKADQQVAIDLLDTLKANEAGCVGLAANMIGVRKCVIAVNMGFMNVAMFNPVIVSRSGEYEAEEGCLSLTGTRPCTRYEEIEVEYFDINWKSSVIHSKAGQLKSFSMKSTTATVSLFKKRSYFTKGTTKMSEKKYLLTDQNGKTL